MHTATQGKSSDFTKAWTDLTSALGESPGEAGDSCGLCGDKDTGGGSAGEEHSTPEIPVVRVHSEDRSAL